MSLVVIDNFGYRYAVEKVRMVNENGEMFTASFIVIKNHYDIIVSFTRLETFAIPFKNKPIRKYNYTRAFLKSLVGYAISTK